MLLCAANNGALDLAALIGRQLELHPLHRGLWQRVLRPVNWKQLALRVAVRRSESVGGLLLQVRLKTLLLEILLVITLRLFLLKDWLRLQGPVRFEARFLLDHDDAAQVRLLLLMVKLHAVVVFIVSHVDVLGELVTARRMHRPLGVMRLSTVVWRLHQFRDRVLVLNLFARRCVFLGATVDVDDVVVLRRLVQHQVGSLRALLLDLSDQVRVQCPRRLRLVPAIRREHALMLFHHLLSLFTTLIPRELLEYVAR